MPLPEGWLTGWMREWNRATRRRALLVAAAVGLTVAIQGGLRLGGVFTQSDTTHYLHLAAGRAAMMPFASRQLGPLVVRGLTRLGTSVPHGYLIEGLAALVFFFVGVMWLLVRSGVQRWMLWAVAGMFFWTAQFNALVLPDLFYGALLCGFLLLLRRGWVMAAAVMMLPLAVARESTVLVLVCFVVAGWRVLRWREVGVAVGSFGAGTLVVRHLAANALANQEHIPAALYLFAKMPWNFLKNFAGLNPWANVYPACSDPMWQHALNAGPLHAVGYCGFVPELPVRLVGCALASFGLLPLLLWRVRRVNAWMGGREDLMVRFSVVYGCVAFCMAWLLGDSVLRLFEYGWPVFFVALPVGMGRLGVGFRAGGWAGGVVAVHLAMTWAVGWIGGWGLLGVECVGVVAGWWALSVMGEFDALNSGADRGHQPLQNLEPSRNG